MKRSEAVRIVALHLKAIDVNGLDENRPLSYYNADATELLSKLEKVGMKAPGYTYDSECIGSYVEGEWEEE